MSKQDFMKYLSFLKEVFPKANIPSNQEIIATWYKGFQSVSLDIAKNMGEMYFQDEQNAFNYARQKKLKTSKINGNYYFTRTAWNEYLGIETTDESLKKDLEIAELKGKIKSLETQIQAFKSVASSLNNIIEI